MSTRELRSNRNRTETPESGQTTSAETNTWNHGQEDSGNAVANNSEVERRAEIEVTQGRSTPGTVVGHNDAGNVGSGQLSLLQAELEAQSAELIRAQAAAAVARSRLELARIASSSDAAPPRLVEESRIEGWISEQARIRPTTENRHPEPEAPRALESGVNDMSSLANAIVHAVNSSRSQAVPKFIHDLPKFDGTISEWIAFKSVYVDTEGSFSDIQNVARLRQALHGPARETVRALLFTVTDPYEIISTLERRFGRPEVLILTELEQVKRMPRLTEDGRNIGAFASRVANTVAAIKSLGQQQYLYSPELANRVVDKLNIILKYKWFEFKSTRTGVPELVLLSQFLNTIGDQCGAMFAYENAKEERKGRSRPRVNHVSDVRSHTPDSQSEYTESESEYEQARATVATVRTKKHEKRTPPKATPHSVKPKVESREFKCVICAGAHCAHECADFRKLTIDKRWEAAKQFRLCFRCLKNSHRQPYRCKYVPCGVEGCEASHHKLLHNPDRHKATAERKSTTRGNVGSVNHLFHSNTYLKIIPVEISGPLGAIRTEALLDEGSTTTLIERGVADAVAPRGRTGLISLEGIGGQQLNDTNSCLVKINIRGVCSRNLETMTGHTIENLNIASQQVDRQLVRQCEHLKEIEDELCYDSAKPGILIGQDNWHLITTRQLKVGNKHEPVASLTKLGWVLHGQGACTNNSVNFINHVRAIPKEDAALELIREYFSIDSLGIEPRKPTSDPDQRALNILEKTCKKLDNCDRYEAGLLWRSDDESMPDNRNQALSRLYNLENKLDRNATLKAEYSRQVENLVSTGYAERVETASDSPRKWILPHFSVIHPQKGKVRLVFDAKAKCGGKSLNDALLTGPDLLQSLFGVLIRFREGKIAVVADIKEMFLQVKIVEQDRDSLRFLWRGEDRTRPPQEYRMSSLIFGAASSPCTAIYVKNKNASYHEKEHPEVVRATVRNFYMDDYLGAFDDIEMAKRQINAMYKIYKKASFELRGWASNVPEVISDVINARSSDVTTLGKSESERTLGLLWNHKRDTIGFNVNLRNTPDNVIDGTTLPTKRQVTSAVMSVFDPLGIVSPVTVIGKSLIQEIWRSGVGWDEPIPNEHNVTWREFIDNLQLLKHLEVDRFVPASNRTGDLHVFCDASERVYATAIYFVSTNADGKTSSLVAGKAKTAPLKPISIPRLELQAAVLGSRLADSVKRETDYEIENCYYWSDSKTVLSWIKASPRTFKAFVAHRLAEIETLTSPVDWRWVPSALNVADDATKGMPVNFNTKHRWFTGPSFIRNDPETWPKDRQVAEPLPPSGEERTLKVLHTSRNDRDTHLPSVERFSKYLRLVRSVAAVLLAVEVLKGKLRKTVVEKSIRYEHIAIAEALLIQRSQRISFPEEIENMEAGRRISKKSPICKLAVKMKNGLLCLDSRLTEDKERRIPVLHAKEALTKLIMQHEHEKCNHENNNTVINELTQQYYIIGMRSALRYINRRCQWCRCYRGKPHKIPLGNLPIERLTDNQPPFTATAVDYFGPMSITIGRRHEKRWGALYTCLTTRAVHLELAPSLSASSMILSLRRMMARRGTPTVIYSDNGTNFRGAEREIAEAIANTDEELRNFSTNKSIIWKKIPAGAPSMGGAWERLVRSVKTALRATLKERHPTEEVLHTLLLEAEHLVNSRPLTPVNPNLAEEALTPNHFLIGRSCGMSPFGVFSDIQLNNKSWRTAQQLADKFWTRWLQEYKPLLKPRKAQQYDYEDVKIGDIVLILDHTVPRGSWPRGEITSVFPGPDGRTRVTEVRTKAGFVRRPVSRLIVIS